MQVISTSDVCLIATLCVLATGDRERIRENLLNRTSFRTSLDDSQGWILDMIRAFMSANYGEVDEIFKTIRVSFALLCFQTFLSLHGFTYFGVARFAISLISATSRLEPFPQWTCPIAWPFDQDPVDRSIRRAILFREDRNHGFRFWGGREGNAIYS